jgi:alkaline phosphatase D
VAPSVTTDTFARTVLPIEATAGPAAWWFRTQNRHVRMADLDHHGYVVVDLTPDRVQADWWHLRTITRRDPAERWAGGWRLAHGRSGLEAADRPASGPAPDGPAVSGPPAVAPSSR